MSVSSFTNLAPGYCAARSWISGSRTRQGAHQGAQKSMTTGRSLRTTSWSNVASVTCSTASLTKAPRSRGPAVCRTARSSSADGAQRPAQGAHRHVGAALDRAERHCQEVRDLALGEPVEVQQAEQPPLLLRQPGEREAGALALVARKHLLLGRHRL